MSAAGGALPPLEVLLASGGDTRISLDPVLGRNRYGCAPTPDPELADFASSTASVISESAYGAARALYRRLEFELTELPAERLYEQELERLRRELLVSWGLADLPGLEVVFGASGTDLHVIAAQLLAGSAERPALAVMVDGAESGSGVPAALAGRHFNPRSAQGSHVEEGELLAGGMALEVAMVPVRDAHGALREASHVDADFETLVTSALEAGRRVLLNSIDVSKTGLLAPSLACVQELARHVPRGLEVLIDACQLRLAPATLRAYLDQGFMVAVTGSKFLSGPTFCGAILLPAGCAQRLRRAGVPASLAPYSARADWPASWQPERGLGAWANFGLLVRWEAALSELRRFRSLPETAIESFLSDFARAVESRLSADPAFELLRAPALDRSALGPVPLWDRHPTIFSFLLLHPPGAARKGPLGAEATKAIYQALSAPGVDADGQAALRAQVGQPVACGARDGQPLAALRLCASARLVYEAIAHGSAPVIARATATLDRLAELVRAAQADVDRAAVAHGG